MTALNITQEQYDKAIRAAKVQALRDAVDALEPYNGRARVAGDEFRNGIDYAQEALTDIAANLEAK